MDFKMDDIIDYDNGIMSGTGLVVGCAVINQPVIGKTYIIKDLSKNIPNDTYKFNTFVCAECHISERTF